MSFELLPYIGEMTNALTVDEILSCNEQTKQYELYLSGSEAKELAAVRDESLVRAGRLEFSGGIVKKLILAFYDSPYLSRENYCETLFELIELFYQLKNETMDKVGDDELIDYMRYTYDQCRGSMEAMQTESESMARRIRFGSEPVKEGEEEEDDELD